MQTVLRLLWHCRERDHHSSNRSRSRSRGRDFSYNNTSNTASSSGGGFRRKTFRDYERERDWDCPNRDAPQRNEVFRDYQHGYQRDYQHGYQRDYQHRNYHHREGRDREGPPQDYRDRHQRDHQRDGGRQGSQMQQQSHGYGEEREDGGRIGRIRDLYETHLFLFQPLPGVSEHSSSSSVIGWITVPILVTMGGAVSFL
ncbi:hypothetical protein E2C01_048445 [Portunus trituberculatus]|uniref:Uncharacterized protein n=1 Tax=Portunus trituberculatus TaxID=210409 RepID=A0A5B7GDD9_PORTR|nr:hypothetical protein [Portunus trituberculatus]